MKFKAILYVGVVLTSILFLSVVYGHESDPTREEIVEYWTPAALRQCKSGIKILGVPTVYVIPGPCRWLIENRIIIMRITSNNEI